MFDFTNYTYSAALTIISTLFGLAYPLIIGCIEKIDSRFNSTILTARFKKEPVFKYFKDLLLINLVISVVFPFLLDNSSYARFYITFQIILVVLLIFSALKLFNKILIYYDSTELQELILNDYYKARGMGNKQDEALFFTQWADLTSILLLSADTNIQMSIYSVWEKYVNDFVSANEGKENLYDGYFYSAITRINENLCKSERRPITINNSNSILDVFINPTDKISERSYIFLWKNLKIQLYYNREDWIYNYWQHATSKYISLEHLEDIDTQNTKEKKHYLEFHIMLCAVLLHESRNDILKKIIYYSTSEGRDYPLVPSKLSDIFALFHMFYNRAVQYFSYFESNYSISSLYGLNDNEALGIVFQYLALLVYRLYTLVWYDGPEMVFNNPRTPDTLKELKNYKDEVNCLKHWIIKTYTSRDLLSIMDIENFDDYLNDLTTVRYSGRFKIPSPLDNINRINSDIEKKISELNRNQDFDEDIVNHIFYSIATKIKKLRKKYKYFEGKTKGLKNWEMDCSAIYFYPNPAFVKDSDISYVNIDGSVAHSLIYKFTRDFASFFFQQNAQKVFTIANSDLFKILDKLIINNQQVVISFDIHWDYYINRINELQKVDDTEYKYKDIQIINLGCPERNFSQTVYVLDRNDLPVLSYKAPTKTYRGKYNLKKFTKSLHLYLSVLKIKDNKDLVNTDKLKEQGVDEDTYSVLTAIWRPQLAFKSNINLIKIAIKYIGLDEGVCTNIDEIKPINNM